MTVAPVSQGACDTQAATEAANEQHVRWQQYQLEVAEARKAVKRDQESTRLAVRTELEAMAKRHKKTSGAEAEEEVTDAHVHKVWTRLLEADACDGTFRVITRTQLEVAERQARPIS
jgi:hypothetical protein